MASAIEVARAMLCFFTMDNKVKAIVIEFGASLKQLYGKRLEQVILFGSQARGDAVEGSDIDVMIVLNGEVNVGEEIARTSKICSDLSLENDGFCHFTRRAMADAVTLTCLMSSRPAAWNHYKSN